MTTPTIIGQSIADRNIYHMKESIADDVKFTKSGGQNMKVDESNESMVTTLSQNNKVHCTISSDQNVDDTTMHDESIFKFGKPTCIAKPRINREVSDDNIQICNTRHASSLVEEPSFGSNIITSSNNMTRSPETIVSKDYNRKKSTNNTQVNARDDRNLDTRLCLLYRLTQSNTSTKRVFEIFANNARIETGFKEIKNEC